MSRIWRAGRNCVPGLWSNGGSSVFGSTGTNALRIGMAGVIALALLALVGVLAFCDSEPDQKRTSAPTPSAAGCAGVLDDSTQECLGPVTDSATLDPAIRDVAEKILVSNREVGAQARRYVRVVLLTPLSIAPKPAASAMSLEPITFSLQGAYVALRRANTSSAFGDQNAPAVQLLLVNQGSRQPALDALVPAIVALGDAEHPVVAVVGLGSSFTGTEGVASALSQRGIPMVGAVTSATSLNAERYSTFHSVSPSNDDYAMSLKDLLDKNPDTLPRNGIVVYDQNKDPYPLTLTEAFTSVLKGYLKAPPQAFAGGTVGNPAMPNVFSPVVTNLCNAVADDAIKLQMVFYAGRVADFPSLAAALRERTCRSHPLTIMVGATGFQLSPQQVNLLDEANVSVIWASSADAPAWIGRRPGTPAGFADFLKAYHVDEKFPSDNLNDGYAVMYHDAVASAVKAIRMATGRDNLPGAADVQTQFSNLTLAHKVAGASGTLSFGGRANGDGRATGKVVMYRQLGKTGPRLPANVPPYLTP
ncbi:hypothetical protein [Micromonospora parva]|uniref:hypothetical protein n=1 Tax=Micromonospora parva TaxID=1464048 RepID=UPI0012DCDEF7|nr:hypothetical protein [Micromonospora parva]